MPLYERDYTTLTSDEQRQLSTLEKMKANQFGLRVSTPISEYPKALRHYKTLFPNHYLDPFDFRGERAAFDELLQEFAHLLKRARLTEREVTRFIKNRRGYFIVASILRRFFAFGHFGAFVFPEFPLGTSYKVDYLVLGRSSEGWGLVFVELESPQEEAVLADGTLGKAFRAGRSQVELWSRWLEASFSSLEEVFDRHRSPHMPLPAEFRKLDTSRLHFVVVAGRRRAFKDRTYRLRRATKVPLLLHYDNLVDCAYEVLTNGFF